MHLDFAVPIVILLFVVVVLFAGLAFAVIEALDRVGWLRNNVPIVAKYLDKKESFNILFALCLLLLLGVGYEVVTREVPSVPGPPVMRISAPSPPIIVTPPSYVPPPLIVPGPKEVARINFTEPTFAFDVGKQFSANIGCKTGSEAPARRVTCEGQMFIDYASQDGTVSAAAQDENWSLFLKQSNPKANPDGPTVPKDGVAWGTSFGPVLTPELRAMLDGPKIAAVIVGVLFYSDGEGAHRTELCTWVQPPVTASPHVWHYCHQHNGIVY
jgi:hypothetical protein